MNRDHHEDKKRFFLGSEVLSDLREEEMDALLCNATTRELVPGEPVWRQGDLIDALILVKEGEIEISSADGEHSKSHLFGPPPPRAYRTIPHQGSRHGCLTAACLPLVAAQHPQHSPVASLPWGQPPGAPSTAQGSTCAIPS